MELIVLGVDKPNETSNYGDCILINTGTELFIYDCGCQEHASKVISYMECKGINKAKLILSHNDSDHFDGIPFLIESNKLSCIRTVLLLKYKDEILKRIDDKRKTRHSIEQQILNTYSNIASLSGKVKLEDIYEMDSKLTSGVYVVGPCKEYMLDTVAKRLDGREGNSVDGETAVNATSVQLKVILDKYNILLCGDSSFSAIEDKISSYNAIQLPHHGKRHQAELIFKEKHLQPKTVYIVSDNTGGSNGGSDDLDERGHIVLNTKSEGDILINNDMLNKLTGSCGVLGVSK